MKLKKYIDAIKNFQDALEASMGLYDSKLINETKNLIKKAEKKREKVRSKKKRKEGKLPSVVRGLLDGEDD